MSTLAQQLEDPEAAGSFYLQCSVDALRVAAEADGYALFDINLQGIKGKRQLIDVVSRAAGFPPGFGANWDALADALCDLSWQPSTGYVLLIRNADDTLGLSAKDREIVQDIFSNTVDFWRQRKKPFWIFFA